MYIASCLNLTQNGVLTLGVFQSLSPLPAVAKDLAQIPISGPSSYSYLNSPASVYGTPPLPPNCWPPSHGYGRPQSNRKRFNNSNRKRQNNDVLAMSNGSSRPASPNPAMRSSVGSNTDRARDRKSYRRRENQSEDDVIILLQPERDARRMPSHVVVRGTSASSQRQTMSGNAVQVGHADVGLDVVGLGLDMHDHQRPEAFKDDDDHDPVVQADYVGSIPEQFKPKTVRATQDSVLVLRTLV